LPEHVRVLANLAERAEDINLERAKGDLKQAQEEVGNPSLGVEPDAALDHMALAQARIDAAEKK
jgi:F0F1-type ATP synthase epsilon subunit